MIRVLRKKFVITAMTAITVLILFMLGTINAANIVMVRKEIDRTLHMISENEEASGDPARVPAAEPVRPRLPVDIPKNDYDTWMSSNFFVVRFDGGGNIVSKDTSRTSAVTEEEAEELAVEVYHSGNLAGKSGKFHYLMREVRGGGGTSIVFLDSSGERFSYFRVLFLSVAAGLACWGIMLVFVMLLSRKAIRPVAENIERQQQFVTNAGHEIKTPLAIIRSNTEAMELYIGENKWSRNIKGQVERLNGLMNNLLILARMEELGGEARKETFPLDGIFGRVVREFTQPMEARHILVQTEIQPDMFISADQGQIERLIVLLLDNAVKYTDENGKIQVSLAREAGLVQMRVQNSCERLPDVAADQLFDRFYRGDTARTQKNGGYGIGLSVARSIVRANDGRIRAEYTGENKISFIVHFKSVPPDGT